MLKKVLSWFAAKDKPLVSKYPGCPPGWEPPTAPVMKYSTADTCINAYLIEPIMPDIAAYIGAEYTPGTVFKEVSAFFTGPMPETNDEGEYEGEVNKRWTIKGETGTFSISMELGEGYFFCYMSVLRDQYFEAKALLESLRIKANQLP